MQFAQRSFAFWSPGRRSRVMFWPVSESESASPEMAKERVAIMARDCGLPEEPAAPVLSRHRPLASQSLLNADEQRGVRVAITIVLCAVVAAGALVAILL